MSSAAVCRASVRRLCRLYGRYTTVANASIAWQLQRRGVATWRGQRGYHGRRRCRSADNGCDAKRWTEKLIAEAVFPGDRAGACVDNHLPGNVVNRPCGSYCKDYARKSFVRAGFSSGSKGPTAAEWFMCPRRFQWGQKYREIYHLFVTATERYTHARIYYATYIAIMLRYNNNNSNSNSETLCGYKVWSSLGFLQALSRRTARGIVRRSALARNVVPETTGERDPFARDHATHNAVQWNLGIFECRWTWTPSDSKYTLDLKQKWCSWNFYLLFKTYLQYSICCLHTIHYTAHISIMTCTRYFLFEYKIFLIFLFLFKTWRAFNKVTENIKFKKKKFCRRLLAKCIFEIGVKLYASEY